MARDAGVVPCPALDDAVTCAAGATRARVLAVAGAACDAALARCSDAMSVADVAGALRMHPHARVAPDLPGPVAALLSRHEAGHAVAACMLPGCGALDSVTVVPVGANPWHATVLRRAGPPDPALAARHHGVVILAGPAAERWRGGDRPWVASDLHGARLSAMALAALAGDCPADAPPDHPAVAAAYAALEAEAEAFVAAHADAIDGVAAMLRRLGTLDGEEVYAACGRERPPA